MKNLLICALLCLTLATSAAAQTPLPSATPTEDDNVLKISTTLIQLDVVVTDKKGAPVTDLKPGDFEVYENGKKQDISNFSFVSVDGKTAPNETLKSPNAPKNSIPLPPIKLKAEQVRRTYALLVDDLGLNFGNIVWVKQSLKKFVNEQMQPGDLVAVIRTGSGIGALQSFTSDKRQLIAAIEKIRWNSYGRSGIGNFNPIETTLKEDLAGMKRSDGTARSPQGNEQDNKFEKEINEFRNDNFSVGTLGALSYVIGGMRDLPGRKAIMLFSEGFTLTTDGAPNRVLDAMRVLADMANRSSVVLYTLDPRGLQVPGMANAEDDIPDVFNSSIAARLGERETNFRESQQSLRYLAYETGGFPFLNQNSLDLGMRRVINDQGSYYLLGYQPNDETFDPKKNKFNRLEVKITRPNLKVRYRSGFFGVTDEKIKNVAQTPQRQLTAALVSPFGASEINLDLYSIFYNDDRNRSFIRSLVYIDPKDLTFAPDAEGFYRAKFEVIAMIFDANGAAADNKITVQEMKFTAEKLAKAKETGIIYDLPVPIVKAGAYQFRIALRDSATGKIGAVSQFIEVPNLKKNKLTLSNLILTNFTADEWKKVSLDRTATGADKSALLDTTLRRFKRGTLLRYSYVIYNAKTGAAQKPQMEIQTRLIRDGKVLFEGSPTAFNSAAQTDLKRLQAAGAITLGNDLATGNYVLQLVVFDNANGVGGSKQKFATQFVEFEIVE